MSLPALLGYLLLVFAEVYVTIAVTYYYFLLVVFATRKRESLEDYGQPETRFGILVPAHNEEDVIGNLLCAVKELNYPKELYKVFVIADNCLDRTKEVATRLGANVFERNDDRNRGKGFALSWALKTTDILEYDAVVVIDADCVPETNLLKVMDVKMRANFSVVQAYNGSYRPDAGTPAALLLHVGNLMENRFFCYPKSLLKIGAVFLQGTGMCFSRNILKKYPWNAFSIVEDLEYSLTLIAGGERIAYTIETSVFTHEPATHKGMREQKLRSASGLAAVVKKNFIRLLKAGIAKKDIALFDAAMCLLLTNKNFVLAIMLAALVASIIMNKIALIVLNLTLIMLMIIYVGFGFLSAGVRGREFFKIIIYLPIFIVRMTVISILGILGYKKTDWVRTARQ